MFSALSLCDNKNESKFLRDFICFFDLIDSINQQKNLISIREGVQKGLNILTLAVLHLIKTKKPHFITTKLNHVSLISLNLRDYHVSKLKNVI